MEQREKEGTIVRDDGRKELPQKQKRGKEEKGFTVAKSLSRAIRCSLFKEKQSD